MGTTMLRAGGRVLITAAALAACAAGTATPAAAQTTGDVTCVAARAGALDPGRLCFPRAGQVSFVADFGPAPSRRTQVSSAINVPTPLDVDGRPGADVVATFRVLSTSEFVLQVDKAPLAAAMLPVQVAAVLKHPGGGTDRYIFGYDTRTASAPGRFTATLRPAITPAGTDLSVDVTTSGAAGSLTALGQLHTAGAGEAIVDPTIGRVSFSDPVPAGIGAKLSFPAEGTAQPTKATLTTGQPSLVGIDVSSVKGAKELRVGGSIDRLHGSLTATLLETAVPGSVPAGSKKTELTASRTGAPVTAADLVLTELVGGVQDTKTVIGIDGLPDKTTVTIDPATASAPLVLHAKAEPAAGVVDVERVEGEGDAQRLEADRFARVVTVPDAQDPKKAALRSAAARITGLEELEVAIGEELVDVRNEAAAGPLQVLVTGVGPTVSATATELTACTRFAVAVVRLTRSCSEGAGDDAAVDLSLPKTKVILLEGSGTSTGTVDFRVEGLEGKNLIGKVTGLPRRTEAVVAGPEKVEVRATGGRLGLAEVRLTDGAEDDTLASQFDGVVVRKRYARSGPGDYSLERDVVFARVRDVAQVDFSKRGDDVVALLDSTRQGAFLVDVHSEDAPTEAQPVPVAKRVRAQADDLPRCVQFALAGRRVERRCSADAGADPQDPPAQGSAKVLLLEGSEAAGGTVAIEADGLPGGKKVYANETGLPRRLEAVIAGAERLDLDTVGGAIGRAEVRLTDGATDDALPETHDGVVVRKKLERVGPGRFRVSRDVVFARLRQLHKLRFASANGDLSATVDSARTDAFKVDIENDEMPSPDSFLPPGAKEPVYLPPVVRYLWAEASALQRNTTMSFSDATGAVKVGYGADGEIPKFELQTNATGSKYLIVNATNVARRLDFCVHPGSGAAGLGGDTAVCNLRDADDQPPLGTGLPNGPTILAEAADPVDPANPMTVSFIDCKQVDADGGCGADKDPARFISAWNLQLRKLAFQLNTPSDGKQRVWLDTDGQSVKGNLRILLDRGLEGHTAGGEVHKVHATLPAGFGAQDRWVRIGKALTGFPTQDARAGTITCPEKTDIYVTASTLGINAGLTGVLCDNPNG